MHDALLAGTDARNSPRVLLVVPPFAAPHIPSLGCHLLQACARQAGFSVEVYYASFDLASAIGEHRYRAICFSEMNDCHFLGEALFAFKAFGITPDDTEFLDLAHECSRLVDEIASRIVAGGYDVVGCTSTFEQTTASLAILKAVKALSPRTVTLLGGSNCRGEMAAGILGLAGELDHVFSGESESTFVRFLEDLAAGRAPATHSILEGEPCLDLDGLPLPDFSEFFEQLHAVLPDSPYLREGSIWLPYESSRGCWWGEKHHCTFCGQSGADLAFRERSPGVVLADLGRLPAMQPEKKILMVDNIMPYRYFSSLIPALGRGELPGVSIFYQQKANLGLDKVAALMQAGVKIIQPGIESLSSPVLDLMDKGTTASQNLRLLRYGRSVGMKVYWNVLYGFPGDQIGWYEAMHDLFRRIHHLFPPAGTSFVSLDRFSPYFMRPEAYRIRNIRPLPEYGQFLPAGADIDRIASHFLGDYESGSADHPEIMVAIREEIGAWRERWSSTEENPPVLLVERLEDGRLALFDTRGLSQDSAQFIDEGRARLILAGASRFLPADDLHRWAVAASFCVPLDGALVPLAVAAPELLARFEARVP